MIKRILIMAAIVVSLLSASAQTPLPLNKDVKHGTLPNGLNYYILHNEQPKERANFYIAQKVGSTLETQEQLGLAHFLEHMAFNGTEHYPGKSMLEYLQSKGIRFGADINAGTSFDETIYNINNVPTNDQALIDSVLLALRDWSGSISLEEAEIEAERGVIEEEWRMRNDATVRMLTAVLPQIYDEYQYQQMPIGKMEIVKNFKPQTLRDYYHKWYRPDLQGIVIVGDFDANQMEKKVKEMFADIPMPANAAERIYPAISDNKDPRYVYFSDKEFPYTLISVMFKSDRMPIEYRNTVEYYVSEIIYKLIADMANERLADFAKDPQCQYAQASVEFGPFVVSKTKNSLSLNVIAKGDSPAALSQAMEIMARAFKTGFTASELTRARDKMTAHYETRYNERKNIENEELGNELCQHFIDNIPLAGVEEDYQFTQQMLPMIPLDAINQTAASLLTDENQVILVCEPDNGTAPTFTSEDMIGIVENKLGAEYEAMAEEKIDQPLISNLPTPGKITGSAEGAYGTILFTLSNGVKVVVKPTDFKSDEVLIEGIMRGGKQSYAAQDAPYVLLAEDAYSVSKLGNFDRKTLDKYLAGKNVKLELEIGNVANIFKGSSTVKDLPTLMEMIYASFTSLDADQPAYDAHIDQLANILKTVANNPNMIFQRRLTDVTTGNNPMQQIPSAELLMAGDYTKELNLIKDITANAADWTFVVTGNVDPTTFLPLMEQYLASLPSNGASSGNDKILTDMDIVKGKVTDTFKQKMETPGSTVYMIMSGRNVPYSVEAEQKLEILGNVLMDVYLQTLREEEGGTYAPAAYGGINPYTGTWQIVTGFQTNNEMQTRLKERAEKEFEKLLKEGASAELFNKAREAAKKQYEINVKTNQYWMDNLTILELGVDRIGNNKSAIDDLTLEDFNRFISNLYDGENRIEVVMEGE